MDRLRLESALNSILDDLAAIEHERWAHWQRYMHGKAVKQADGSLVIPAELVRQWDSQIARSFSELSEQERESDREQVHKYLPTIVEAMTRLFDRKA